MKKLITLFASVLVAFTANAQLCPDNNHPHSIDLGLPSGTKWACCNVGATTPEDHGAYYAWGETEGKDNYSYLTYMYYQYQNDSYVYIGDDIAGIQYDVAHVKWGGSWGMPSLDKIEELVNNCSYTWILLNGVFGGYYTGPNGGTIFLPAAGNRWNGDLYEADSCGSYWSSTQYPSDSSKAYGLDFDSGYANSICYNRHVGYTVRPTINGTNSINLPESLSNASKQAIYNLYGIKVANNAADMNTLPPGIYIVNGKKKVIK